MPPNNPSVTVNLLKTRIKANPQGYHARPVVIGFSSLGTRNTIYTLRSDADLAQFGNGEGIEEAAEIGNQAGYPIYFVPIEGTRQSASTPEKTPVSGAVPKTIYGAIKVAGADANGDLLFQGLVAGATLTVPAVYMGTLSVSVTGTAVTLNIPAGTSADDVVTFWDTDPSAADARAIFGIRAEGTGASDAGGVGIATTVVTNGNLTFSAPGQGYEVKLVAAGNNTALSASYGGTGNKQLTINLATDADGTPTSTAQAVVALPAITGGAITVTAGGTGLGLAGVQATFTPLQYGSTGAITVSGTGVDRLVLGIRITRGGTVGSTGLAFVWTADDWVTESAEVLIPASGIVELKDSRLTTGLTVTFTGVLEVGDKWLFGVNKPVVAFATLTAAIDVVKVATSYKFGFITSPVLLSKTEAQTIDATLQAVRQTMWLRGLFNVRERNDGESITTWETSVGNDFLGFNSAKGCIRMCAGTFSHLSTYSGRRYVRPWVFQVAARRCSIAVHQDCMEKALGGLPNIRFAVDSNGIIIDPGIQYDCFPSGALQSQRFICPRTFPGEPGQFYINTSPTMSDPSDEGYSRIEYSDVVWEAARISQTPLSLTLGKTYRDIPEPESDLIPAGALDAADAQLIDDMVNEEVEAFLYSVKTDGNTSASPMPPGERPYKTRRDYAYANENPRKVKGRLGVRLRGVNEQVEEDVTPSLGA